MTAVLIKKGIFIDRHMARMLCQGGSSYWGDASINHRNPKIASNPPEAREEVWNRVSFTALRKNQPEIRRVSDFWPLELSDDTFLLFKPLSLRCFVVATLGSAVEGDLPVLKGHSAVTTCTDP